MPFTADDIDRLVIEEMVKKHPDEVAKRLPIEKRLEGVSVDELLKGIPREKLEELLRRVKENGSQTDSR